MLLDLNWQSRADRLLLEARKSIRGSEFEAENLGVANRLASLIEGLRLAEKHILPHLDEVERESIELMLKTLASRVTFSLFRDWFGPFYQMEHSRTTERIYLAMKEAVVYRAAMLGDPEGLKSQQSLFRNFCERVPKAAAVLNRILISGASANEKKPSAYLVMETYRLLVACEDEMAVGLLVRKEYEKILLSQTFQELIVSDSSLSAFYLTVCKSNHIDLQLTEQLAKDFAQLRPTGNIRRDAFIGLNALELTQWEIFDLFADSLARLRDDELVAQASLVFPILAVKRIRDGPPQETLKLGILPFVDSFDTQSVVGILFPRLQPIPVSAAQIEKLLGMNDAELRPILCKIIADSPLLPPGEKERVLTEFHKPHTGAEIGDIDVLFSKVGANELWCSLALKTGVEMQGRAVGQSYIGQILRPLLRFKPHTVVALMISATRPSNDLDQSIKLLRANYHMPIDFIGPETLAKILISYGGI